MKILDSGYVELTHSWGSDETIIESARMSTNKGFTGWENDSKLLRYLYKNNHLTPFEMCGFTIEVMAPIFVFREWHRHRTQSYNEMSARYIPLPNINYIPTLARCVQDPKNNKQASAIRKQDSEDIHSWLNELSKMYDDCQVFYQKGLASGVPKELARLIIPVGRYSKMRASANLRNWMQFLTLRMDEHAQWEIRQYAIGVSHIVKELFPKTYELFMENK